MLEPFSRNVFQIWRDNGERVPFRVRRWSWNWYCFAVVVDIVISEKDMEYEVDTGKLYGKAEGRFFMRGKERRCDGCLSCAGCYQWEFVGDGDGDGGK